MFPVLILVVIAVKAGTQMGNAVKKAQGLVRGKDHLMRSRQLLECSEGHKSKSDYSSAFRALLGLSYASRFIWVFGNVMFFF